MICLRQDCQLMTTAALNVDAGRSAVLGQNRDSRF